MAIQTTYAQDMAAKTLGSVANQETSNIISRVVEETDGIPFGRVVARGTANDQCLLADAGATSVLGISARYQAIDAGTPNSFAKGEVCSILTKGVVTVTAGANVAAGAAAYFIPASGVITSDADSGNNTAIPGAVFDETVTSGNLVNLRLS